MHGVLAASTPAGDEPRAKYVAAHLCSLLEPGSRLERDVRVRGILKAGFASEPEAAFFVRSTTGTRDELFINGLHPSIYLADGYCTIQLMHFANGLGTRHETTYRLLPVSEERLSETSRLGNLLIAARVEVEGTAYPSGYDFRPRGYRGPKHALRHPILLVDRMAPVDHCLQG